MQISYDLTKVNLRDPNNLSKSSIRTSSESERHLQHHKFYGNHSFYSKLSLYCTQLDCNHVHSVYKSTVINAKSFLLPGHF